MSSSSRAPRVLVVGLDALGVATASELARAGCSLLLADPHLVSAADVNAQGLPQQALGTPKAEATAAALRKQGLSSDARALPRGVPDVSVVERDVDAVVLVCVRTADAIAFNEHCRALGILSATVEQCGAFGYVYHDRGGGGGGGQQRQRSLREMLLSPLTPAQPPPVPASDEGRTRRLQRHLALQALQLYAAQRGARPGTSAAAEVATLAASLRASAASLPRGVSCFAELPVATAGGGADGCGGMTEALIRGCREAAPHTRLALAGLAACCVVLSAGSSGDGANTAGTDADGQLLEVDHTSDDAAGAADKEGQAAAALPPGAHVLIVGAGALGSELVIALAQMAAAAGSGGAAVITLVDKAPGRAAAAAAAARAAAGPGAAITINAVEGDALALPALRGVAAWETAGAAAVCVRAAPANARLVRFMNRCARLQSRPVVWAFAGGGGGGDGGASGVRVAVPHRTRCLEETPELCAMLRSAPPAATPLAATAGGPHAPSPHVAACAAVAGLAAVELVRAAHAAKSTAFHDITLALPVTGGAGGGGTSLALRRAPAPPPARAASAAFDAARGAPVVAVPEGHTAWDVDVFTARAGTLGELVRDVSSRAGVEVTSVAPADRDGSGSSGGGRAPAAGAGAAAAGSTCLWAAWEHGRAADRLEGDVLTLWRAAGAGGDAAGGGKPQLYVLLELTAQRKGVDVRMPPLKYIGAHRK